MKMMLHLTKEVKQRKELKAKGFNKEREKRRVQRSRHKVRKKIWKEKSKM